MTRVPIGQRRVVRLAQVFRVAASAGICAVLAADVCELGRKYDPVAAVGDCLVGQNCVGEWPHQTLSCCRAFKIGFGTIDQGKPFHSLPSRRRPPD